MSEPTINAALDAPADRVRLLRDTYLNTVRGVLDRERPVVLVEFPDYGNVGDSAIFLGELTALEALGHRPPRSIIGSRSWKISEIRSLAGDATVVLSGGGTFGDIWPSHHSRRLALLRALVHNPVVQLPQSLHFRDAQTLAETRRVLQAHRSFHLLVRDPESAGLAANELDLDPILCPDAALVLGPQERLGPVVERVVWLLRDDHESIHPHTSLPADTVDWTRQPLTPLRLAASSLAALRRWRVPPAGLLRATNERVYRPLARERLHRGMRLISAGRVVVTDRLHGHILCLLLGLPHVLLDNAYGKISNFHRMWTDGVSDVVWAESPENALDLALRIADSAR